MKPESMRKPAGVQLEEVETSTSNTLAKSLYLGEDQVQMMVLTVTVRPALSQSQSRCPTAR